MNTKKVLVIASLCLAVALPTLFAQGTQKEDEYRIGFDQPAGKVL